MDFANLKSSLKTKVDNVYLLYGVDIFLLYKSISLIKDVMPNSDVSDFDESVSAEEVVSALRTPSFFGGKRVAVYKLNDKPNSKVINEYIKSPESESVLILMGDSEKNSYSIKGATEVNCNPMAPEILMKLIANQIAPKTITKNAAEFLVEATGGNYSVINNELNKIVSYYNDVKLLDTVHLNEFVTKTVDYQIYELGSAILFGQYQKANDILAQILASDVPEYMILGGLVSQFRRIYYSVATDSSIESVGKVLGCSPYAVKYARRDFMGKKLFIKNKYKEILDIEFMVKSGQIGVINALSSVICH